MLIYFYSDLDDHSFSLDSKTEMQPRNPLQVVFSLVVAGVFAAPQYESESEQRQARFDDSREHVPILKDERVIDNDGRYTFDVATGNGIVVSESGSPGAVGSINSAGSFA